MLASARVKSHVNIIAALPLELDESRTAAFMQRSVLEMHGGDCYLSREMRTQPRPREEAWGASIFVGL